jgi:hypothetical protein
MMLAAAPRDVSMSPVDSIRILSLHRESVWSVSSSVLVHLYIAVSVLIEYTTVY